MAPALRQVRAVKARTGNIAQQLEIGPHRLLADAAGEIGGDDLGPDPHELLDAALAACTALTLRLYAKRKGMDLVDLDVRVDHDEHGGVYRIRRDIRLSGGLSAAERDRLLEIANKCPLHRTLSGSFALESKLVD